MRVSHEAFKCSMLSQLCSISRLWAPCNGHGDQVQEVRQTGASWNYDNSKVRILNSDVIQKTHCKHLSHWFRGCVMLAAFFLQFVDGVPTFAPDGGVIEERMQTSSLTWCMIPSLILTTNQTFFTLWPFCLNPKQRHALQESRQGVPGSLWQASDPARHEKNSNALKKKIELTHAHNKEKYTFVWL